jgi:ribosomal protein S28E/S33
MSKLIVVFLLFFSVCSVVSAQDIHEDLQGTWKARVVEVVSQHEEIIGGTGTPAVVQEIQAEILEGPQRGEVVTFINDYIPLREGQRFYLNYFLTSSTLFKKLTGEHLCSFLFFFLFSSSLFLAASRGCDL